MGFAKLTFQRYVNLSPLYTSIVYMNKPSGKYKTFFNIVLSSHYGREQVQLHFDVSNQAFPKTLLV